MTATLSCDMSQHYAACFHAYVKPDRQMSHATPVTSSWNPGSECTVYMHQPQHALLASTHPQGVQRTRATRNLTHRLITDLESPLYTGRWSMHASSVVLPCCALRTFSSCSQLCESPWRTRSLTFRLEAWWTEHSCSPRDVQSPVLQPISAAMHVTCAKHVNYCVLVLALSWMSWHQATSQVRGAVDQG